MVSSTRYFALAFVLFAAVSAQAAKESTTASAPGAAGAPGTSDIAALISALPICFQTCASKAATAPQIGCKSITDLPCYCPKPQFVNATSICIASSGDNGCPELAKNTTALTEYATVFQQACSTLASASNGTAGPSGTSGGSAHPASTNATTASTHNASSASASPAASAVISAAVFMITLSWVGVATML